MLMSKTRRPPLSGHLHPAPALMRDFTGCLSERAVKISTAPSSAFSCSSSRSGATSTSNSSVSSAGGAGRSPLSCTVTCLYRTTLATHVQRLVRITWSKGGGGGGGPVFSVAVDESHPPKADGAGDQLLQKKKGSRSFAAAGSAIGLYWDVSAAKYGAGPEPVRDFYVAVVVDAEFGLLLGDLSGEFARGFEESIPVADFSMVSRREEVVGATLHATQARFREGGREHEIVIRCKGDAGNVRDAEVSVSVDRKKVVNVRRMKWNFRGNQTLFIDGAAVDMLWDIHDWWFGCSSGAAVFLFRTRSALESRLWSDEEAPRGLPGFSLLIQAVKSRSMKNS